MLKAGYIEVVITQNIYIYFVYVLITPVGISPSSENFDRFLLGTGSETRMCEQNVHITLRLDDTAAEWQKPKYEAGKKVCCAIHLFLLI